MCEIENIDYKIRLVDFCLELSNWRQKKTKNIIEFITKADILSKKLVRFHKDMGII